MSKKPEAQCYSAKSQSSGHVISRKCTGSETESESEARAEVRKEVKVEVRVRVRIR